MKIAVVSLELDDSPITNFALIINKLIENSSYIDFINGDRINIEDFDGFILSGSHASFNDDSRWMKDFRVLINEIHKSRKPCFAICLSMQIVAEELGAKVIKSNANEVGFCEVEISNDSKLTKGLPKKFKIFQFHNDVILDVPKTSILTQKNDVCIQGFNIDNFYAVQYHPEVPPEVAKFIAKRDSKNIDKMLNGVTQETYYGKDIFMNFLEIVRENMENSKL